MTVDSTIRTHTRHFDFPPPLCPLGVGSSLNSFVSVTRLGYSFAWSLWHLLLILLGVVVAGRSHGPGCTAASYTGANQWHSLLDSLEHP